MTRICLTMIVKDEAHVIARCLASARDLIDDWVIVDTGSSDETMQIIENSMTGIPGQLVQRPWVNFAHNRNELLDFARLHSESDYALWIDADEVFTDQDKAGTDDDLTLDGYFLPVTYGTTHYSRLAFTRIDKDWRWVGPVHEYLELADAVSGNLTAPGVLVRHDGARSKDPTTYEKDLVLLETAMAEDPENTRLRFYYAQSLRDAGQPVWAREAYEKRATMGGWEQEVFISLLELARISERLGEHCTDAYLAAYNTCPTRAEPLVELARIERQRERFHVGLLYAATAVDLPHPGSGALFVDSTSYTWRAWDEYALNAWYAGYPDEAREAAAKALFANPTDQRLIDNLRLCGG